MKGIVNKYQIGIFDQLFHGVPQLQFRKGFYYHSRRILHIWGIWGTKWKMEH